MKILSKLIFSGGVLGLLAGMQTQGKANTLADLNSKADSLQEKSISTFSDLANNPLNSLNVGVSNPYENSADAPFNYSRKSAALESRAYCQGRYWTEGQYMGTNSDGPLTIAIVQGRIYVRVAGGISDNPLIIVHASGSPYPWGKTNGNVELVEKCVNARDPSTVPDNKKYLGATTSEGIYCNNVLIKDKMLLGVYIGGDNVRTYEYAHFNKTLGLLRITAFRDAGGNVNNYNGFNASLIDETVAGENGSYLVDPVRSFNIDHFNGCFYNNLPIYPDPDPMPNCTSGPTVGAISNKSQTGLTFGFSGSGISSIKWTIAPVGGSQVAEGTANNLSGATSASVSFSSLNPGTYNLSIQGANCNSGVSSTTFVIEPPVVVVPTCVNGPSISSITNVTGSSATINYQGDNMSIFSWRILKGNSVMASGKTGKLTSKSANLEFYYLKNGAYTFELTPEDCKTATNARVAAATQSFNVSSTDTRTACNRGPTLGAIVSSDSKNLTFRFDGDGVYAIDWNILSNGTSIRQNRVNPTRNTPTVSYVDLPNGTYSFQIQGGSCTSVTSSPIAFTVSNSLPIYISSFSGKSLEKGVELSWEVVSEKDGSGFEVIRYDNQMQSATVLGKVGLTDKRVGTYKFVDENPLLGNNYYQLNMIDLDGSSEKSRIISVKSNLISETVVSPNPASQYVDIQFNSRKSGKGVLEIYNMAGMKVSTSSVNINDGANNHKVNVKNLGQGHYFINVTAEGQTSKMRFVKGE